MCAHVKRKRNRGIHRGESVGRRKTMEIRHNRNRQAWISHHQEIRRKSQREGKAEEVMHENTIENRTSDCDKEYESFWEKR